MVAGPCKKARAAPDCQEEEKIAVVGPIVPKGLNSAEYSGRSVQRETTYHNIHYYIILFKKKRTDASPPSICQYNSSSTTTTALERSFNTSSADNKVAQTR